MKKPKPIHMIIMRYAGSCYPVCDTYSYMVCPIDAPLKRYIRRGGSKGTFDVKKVTCKRCLKHSWYKEAVDKADNPLFYWNDND